MFIARSFIRRFTSRGKAIRHIDRILRERGL